MSNPVESFLNEQVPMLKLVDEILEAWDKQGCYQVPALMVSLSVKLNWNSTQARLKDPIIRAYLKDHPMWAITRGAHGGIISRAEFLKKEAAKIAKEAAKSVALAMIANKVAQATATTDIAVIDTALDEQDNTNIVSE